MRFSTFLQESHVEFALHGIRTNVFNNWFFFGGDGEERKGNGQGGGLQAWRRMAKELTRNRRSNIAAIQWQKLIQNTFAKRGWRRTHLNWRIAALETEKCMKLQYWGSCKHTRNRQANSRPISHWRKMEITTIDCYWYRATAAKGWEPLLPCLKWKRSSMVRILFLMPLC